MCCRRCKFKLQFLYHASVIMSYLLGNSILQIVVNNEEVVNLIKPIFLIHSMLPVVSASVLFYITPECHDCVRTGVAVIVVVDESTAFFVAYLFAMITLNT